MIREHQRKIERLVGMDREVIKSKRIQALVEGVRKGHLSINDVTTYTNITSELFTELMRG